MVYTRENKTNPKPTKNPKKTKHIFLMLVFAFWVLRAKRMGTVMACKEGSLGHAEELRRILKNN